MIHNQASDGRRKEFDTIALCHTGELFSVAMRMTRSRAEAEDLVQETVMRAWTFWSKFERGTNCRAWLHRILVNSFVNRYRRRKREMAVLNAVHSERQTHPSTVPVPPGYVDGVGDEVHAALRELPEKSREILLSVDVYDRSYRDVAASLECPIGTVMSRLHRARRTLKEQLHCYARNAGYTAHAA